MMIAATDPFHRGRIGATHISGFTIGVGVFVGCASADVGADAYVPQSARPHELADEYVPVVSNDALSMVYTLTVEPCHVLDDDETANQLSDETEDLEDDGGSSSGGTRTASFVL